MVVFHSTEFSTVERYCTTCDVVVVAVVLHSQMMFSVSKKSYVCCNTFFPLTGEFLENKVTNVKVKWSKVMSQMFSFSISYSVWHIQTQGPLVLCSVYALMQVHV